MRLGLFGGSFDPVHVGHYWIAQAALETLGLDRVVWIPAATSPLKQEGTQASSEHRLEMLRMTVEGCRRHVVDDREIRRGAISYTVDTVAELCREHPQDELFLIMGSDSLATIQQWRQPGRLLEMAMLAVVQRGGEPELDFSVLRDLVDQQRAAAIRRHVITMPQIELSSREIRARVAGDRSVRYRVPLRVESYISLKGLYR